MRLKMDLVDEHDSLLNNHNNPGELDKIYKKCENPI